MSLFMKCFFVTIKLSSYTRMFLLHVIYSLITWVFSLDWLQLLYPTTSVSLQGACAALLLERMSPISPLSIFDLHFKARYLVEHYAFHMYIFFKLNHSAKKKTTHVCSRITSFVFNGKQ